MIPSDFMMMIYEMIVRIGFCEDQLWYYWVNIEDFQTCDLKQREFGILSRLNIEAQKLPLSSSTLLSCVPHACSETSFVHIWFPPGQPPLPEQNDKEQNPTTIRYKHEHITYPHL